MFKKWKRAVDNNKVFGALLTNLPKAFDYIPYYDLLIAKQNAYGLSLYVLKPVHSYPQNRKQRTKIGSSSSLGNAPSVPQGSILEPLLFNKVLFYFISSLFYFGKNYTIVIEIILFTMSI